MALITISLKGDPPACPDSSGGPAIVGDSLILSLDPAKFTSLPANPITAQIVTMTPNPSVVDCWDSSVGPGFDYELLVADSDLPLVGGVIVADIDTCDLIAAPICASCCAALEVRIEALEGQSFSPPLTRFTSIAGVGTTPDLGVIMPQEADTVVQRNGNGDTEYWTFLLGAWELNYTVVSHQVTYIIAEDHGITEVAQMPHGGLPAQNWPQDKAIVKNVEDCIEFWQYNGSVWSLTFTEGNCPGTAYYGGGDPNP